MFALAWNYFSTGIDDSDKWNQRGTDTINAPAYTLYYCYGGSAKPLPSVQNVAPILPVAFDLFDFYTHANS